MNTHRSKRRGVSLMMVTAVVAIASVLGMAILSGNALQAQASANQDRALQADALAESGVNLGLYYLQNVHDSTKCPIGISSLGVPPPDNAPYTRNGITLGADVAGTIDLSVNRLSVNRYTVVSKGKATGGVERQMSVVADVNYFSYGLIASNLASGTFTIPAGTTVAGDVHSSVAVTNNGTVSGRIFASSAGGNAPLGGIQGLLGVALPSVPNALQVNHYTAYVHNGVPGVAELILLGTLDNETRGPTVLNPAGVYYTAGHLTVGNNVTVNGTLVAVGGQIRVQGSGSKVTPAKGFPALVSDQDLSFRAHNAAIEANGLTYVGGRLLRSSGTLTGTRMTVNGALLFGSATPSIDPNVLVQVNFDRARASVPSLNTLAPPAPSSVSVVSFSNHK